MATAIPIGVNSQVMRSKAADIRKVSTDITQLYAQMLQIVTSTANRMKGTAIETQKREFEQMKGAFKIFNDDLAQYSKFLESAAVEYERVENTGIQNAEKIMP